MKPEKLGLIVLALTLALSLSVASADDSNDSVRVFYYGLGDGYYGKRHAASWHGETPEGWPEVVDLERNGIATSDWSIPFGTELCLEVTGFPAWAEGAYDERIGTVVCGIVVDRLPRWAEWWFGPCVDVWPAMARKLMGGDFRRIGTVTVRIVSPSQERDVISQCPLRGVR